MSGDGRLTRELRNLLADWLVVYEMAVHLQDEPHRQDSDQFEGKNNDIGGEGDCHALKSSRHDETRKRMEDKAYRVLPCG